MRFRDVSTVLIYATRRGASFSGKRPAACHIRVQIHNPGLVQAVR